MVTGVEAKVREINKSLNNLAIEIRGNKLYLRGTFPPQPDDKEHTKPYRQRVALGYSADMRGLGAAEPFARRLALQLAEDRHNKEPKFWTVAQPQSFSEDVIIQEPGLYELWLKYEAYKKTMVSPNTFNRDFRRYRNHINRLPSQRLEQAVAIRDAILSQMTPGSAKRLLVNISACCKWAIKSQLITVNPFSEFAADIKVSIADDDINPFTKAERDKIIEAFKGSKKYGYYAPFVEFCFLTGCRPSEAVALQWKHIRPNQVHFCQTAYEEKGTKIKPGLKTEKERFFPINLQLSGLLLTLKTASAQPTDLVFSSRTGKLIDLSDFNNHAWRGHKNRKGVFIPGIVWELFGEEGYRSPYQCRHTFITLCLEARIDPKDIAAWVGNSPEIIYRHYAGRNKDQAVPIL
jgi:integrase